MVSPRFILEAAIALFLFGCIAVVVKLISANPFTIGIARLGITVAVLLLTLAFSGRIRNISLATLRTLAPIGIFFALHLLSFFLGIKIGSASLAAIGLSTYGMHLIVLSHFFQRTPMTTQDVLLIAMGIAGSVLAAPELYVHSGEIPGFALGILSGFFYAFLPILHQKHAAIDVYARTLGQFAFALLVFLPFWPMSDWNLDVRDWQGLLFLGVMCTLVAHTLWVRVTTVLPTRTTGVIYYMYVPVTLLLSVIILHERVNLSMMGGAALIILANVFGALRRSQGTAAPA